MEENMDQDSSASIENLLLSSDEMAEKYKELGKDYEYPYVFKISKNGQTLYFLGSHHLLNPEDKQVDKQFESIRSYWEEFLEKTDRKDCVVLVEGWDSFVEKSESRAKKRTEAGFTNFLASKEDIKAFTPEPSRLQVARKLLKKFSKDEVMYSYFAAFATQWHRMKNKPGFEEYMDASMRDCKRQLEMKGYDISLENFTRLHDETHDHTFDKNNRGCFYNDHNPTTNDVSREEGLLRDLHMVPEIKRLWDEGKNIFIVYGSGHAIVQEPALKKLLE